MTTIGLLAAGCLAFAIVSLAVLERTLRAGIDARLTTFALAVGELVDYHHGKLSVDAGDIAQIGALRAPDEHVAVLDRAGRLVYGEQVPSANERSKYRFAQTSKIHDGGAGTVVAWQSERWIADVRRASFMTFALVGLALVALSALFSRALANAMLNPVERMARLAARIEAHDLSARIGAHGNDELSRLAASFDRMLDRLEATFECERRFVADASHELRTPLAVIRAETDLALRRPRETPEYRAALESIDIEVARLETLVDDLLDSMRDRAIAADEPVDVAVIVERVAKRIRAAARGVKVAIDGGAAVVRGHTDSIERAAAAVLHNAATHGGGDIDVRIVGDPAWVRVDVTDEGPGFGPEALEHATGRFWRADSARSRGGTGLGLSIARVLIEAHGGEVRLANRPERGAVVSLLLPAAHSS
jgi:signal transduction histidine kinase